MIARAALVAFLVAGLRAAAQPAETDSPESGEDARSAVWVQPLGALLITRPPVVSAGISYQLSGGAELRGLFLQPKMVVAMIRNRSVLVFRGTTSPPRDITSFGGGVQLGLDLGYHLRVGPLYLAPVIGIRSGFGRVPADGVSMYPVELGSALHWKPTFDVNLNLLRVGAVFHFW